MGPLPWGFQDEIQDSSSVTRLLGDPKSQISFGWLLYIPYIPLESIMSQIIPLIINIDIYIYICTYIYIYTYNYINIYPILSHCMPLYATTIHYIPVQPIYSFISPGAIPITCAHKMVGILDPHYISQFQMEYPSLLGQSYMDTLIL